MLKILECARQAYDQAHSPWTNRKDALFYFAGFYYRRSDCWRQLGYCHSIFIAEKNGSIKHKHAEFFVKDVSTKRELKSGYSRRSDTFVVLPCRSSIDMIEIRISAT